MSRLNINGPLTTAWAQPASCTIPLFFLATNPTEFAVSTVSQGVTCVMGISTTCTTGPSSCSEIATYSTKADSRCFPPGTLSLASYGFPSGFYSPGYVCPQSYTTACETTMGGTGNFLPFFPLIADETAIGCCPRLVV